MSVPASASSRVPGPSPVQGRSGGEAVAATSRPAAGRLARGEWALLGTLAVWLALASAWRWPVFTREAFGGNSLIDMAVYAYGAELMRTGGTPYVTFWDHKPPMMYFFHTLGLSVSGGQLWGVWLVSLAAGLLALWYGHLATRRALGAWPAALGSVFFAFSVPSIFPLGMTEWYALPVSAAAAYALLRRDPREQNPLALGAAFGALGAVALMLKSNLIGGPLSAGLVASGLLLSSARVAAWGRLIGGGVLGAAAVMAPVLIYLAAVGALGAFREQALDYNMAYLATGGRLGMRLRAVNEGIEHATRFSSAVLPILGWLLAAYQLRHHARRGPLGPALLLAVVWLPVELLLATASGRAYAHYFTTIYPPLSFLVAYVGYELSSGRSAGPAGGRAHRGAVLPALCATIAAYGLARMFWQQRDDERTAARAAQVDATVAYVRRNVRPDQPLFVWGHAADVYMFSDRKPASPFIYVQPLLTPGYATPARVRAFVEDLRAAEPAVIVDATGRDWKSRTIDGADLTPPLGRWDPAWAYPLVIDPDWKYAAWWSMPPAMREFYDYVAANYVVADSVGPAKWAVYRRAERTPAPR